MSAERLAALEREVAELKALLTEVVEAIREPDGDVDLEAGHLTWVAELERRRDQ